MADDGEFEYLVKNSQRMVRLNNQYENHLYVEEFIKECNVMFVYRTHILEGGACAKFSLLDKWNLFQGETLPNHASNFCRQMKNCMKAWDCLQKTSDLPLSTEIVKQAHELMMEDEKDVLAGEYRESPVFAGYHIFAPAAHIERYMEDSIFRFHETKKDDPIMTATNLFKNMINIHPFEDGNGRILAHVLIQMKCCLLPVILSFFHRCGRRHYIRAVKAFDRKPSMLYTMIVGSLIHCWDNCEQNARMLA